MKKFITRKQLKKELEDARYNEGFLRNNIKELTNKRDLLWDMNCKYCDIYRNYGMQRSIICDSRNCPIYSAASLGIKPDDEN